MAERPLGRTSAHRIRDGEFCGEALRKVPYSEEEEQRRAARREYALKQTKIQADILGKWMAELRQYSEDEGGRIHRPSETQRRARERGQQLLGPFK